MHTLFAANLVILAALFSVIVSARASPLSPETSNQLYTRQNSCQTQCQQIFSVMTTCAQQNQCQNTCQTNNISNLRTCFTCLESNQDVSITPQLNNVFTQFNSACQSTRLTNIQRGTIVRNLASITVGILSGPSSGQTTPSAEQCFSQCFQTSTILTSCITNDQCDDVCSKGGINTISSCYTCLAQQTGPSINEIQSEICSQLNVGQGNPDQADPGQTDDEQDNSSGGAYITDTQRILLIGQIVGLLVFVGAIV